MTAMESRGSMARKIKIIIIILAVIVVVVVGAAIVFFNFFAGKNVTTYKESSEVLINPLIGYAVNADEEADIVLSSLVYIDITWAELEPEEGVYDFDTIASENRIEEWKSEGKHAVLRFICDYPGSESHRDIPDWLYEMTGDGVDYDIEYGKGYSPDYNNETFIKYHEKAIRALGSYLGQDSFVSYVQLGSLGHWGEWHVYYPAGIPRIPDSEVRLKYVEPYIAAFPNARLLMRRPFAELPTGGGLYNDMTGAEDDTYAFLDWINNGGVYEQTGESGAIKACADIWDSAPIGGEFTSSIAMSELLDTEYDRTIELLDATHMSFIGPKVPVVYGDESDYKENAYDLLSHVGYRYYVSQMEISKSGALRNVRLTWVNSGVAPIYWDWQPCMYITNANNEVVERYALDIDLTEIGQGDSIISGCSVKEEYVTDDSYKFWAGIENPETGEPEIYLAMDAVRSGKMSKLK